MPIDLHTLLLPNPLDANDPITFGSVGEDVRFGDGLTGASSPPLSTSSIQLASGGVWGGRQTEQAQSVSVDAPWTESTSTLMSLRALMRAKHVPFQMQWRGLGWPTSLELMRWVRPDGYESYVDEDAAHGSVHRLRLRFLAEDTNVYSATPTIEDRTAASSHSFTATNAGIYEAHGGPRSAWTVNFTASGGSVVNPWIQIGSRRVRWGLTLTSGQILTMADDRTSRIGSLRQDGRATTPGQAAVDWPTLPPGASTVTAGADSGSFALEFGYRSTW